MPRRPDADQRLHRPPPLRRSLPGPVDRHRIRRRPLRKRPHPPKLHIRPNPNLPPLLVEEGGKSVRCEEGPRPLPKFPSLLFTKPQNGDSSEFRRPCETSGLSYFCPTRHPRYPPSRTIIVYCFCAPGSPNPKCCLLYTSPSPRDRQKSRMP